MLGILISKRCSWTRGDLPSLLECFFAWLCSAGALTSLGGCGTGTILGDHEKECTITRCAELGKDCGELLVEGCGAVRCGDCQIPETCGGAGTPNVCGAEACRPSWECEQPLNGYETDGCGERRTNPACEASSACGNGVTERDEACDWKGNVGCSGSTPVCEPDCSGCTRGDEDCTKARCTALGKNCGEIEIDGCGVIRCGECEAPESCGGAGTSDVCGAEDCIPSWECEQPLNGNEKDGCGSRRPNPACAADTNGLLWDGFFQLTDHWISQNSFYWGAAGGNQYSCIVAADRATVVNNIGGRSEYVVKFISRYGDRCNAPSAARAYMAKIPLNLYSEGADRYYSVSIYLPPDFGPLETNEWMQPWEIQTTGATDEVVNLKLKHTASNDNLYFSYGVNPQTAIQLPFSYKSLIGKWSDFIFRLKYSSGTSGIVEVWHKDGTSSDYQFLVSANNVKTYNGASTAEMPFGIYRTNLATTRVLYIGGLRIGTTRESVAHK